MCRTFLQGLLEAISKIGLWPKVKAAARSKPEEYSRYFEDLNRAPNTEIGPKGIFEIAPKEGLILIEGGTTCHPGVLAGEGVLTADGGFYSMYPAKISAGSGLVL